MAHAQPTYFFPHGGGPCFFMPDPRGVWTGMGEFLAGIEAGLAARPAAIIVVSGHWETDGFAFTGSAKPPLIYDYESFPPDTYQLRYDVPGTPALAVQAAGLLRAADLKASVDDERGLDHGVFIPLKVAFPRADIPLIEMSVASGFDPELHLRAGRALAPLRDQGVLILGSGMSFHNMRAYGNPDATARSLDFDRWLTGAVEQPADRRADLLADWAAAPEGRFSHPREEHLLPLMVVAGASAERGERVYGEQVLRTYISGYRFG